MNIAFLPEKVKSELAAVSDKSPVLAARAYGSIEGETGEGYLVSCAGKLLAFSRKAGEDDFRKLSGMFGKEISRIDARQEKFNTFLDMDFNGIPYSIKFSSSEHKELEALVESLKSYKSESAQPAVSGAGRTSSAPQVKIAPPATAKTASSTLTPLEVLAVALMYISSCDSKISEEENSCIVEIFKENKTVLGSSLAYYKAHSYEQFLGNIGALNENQKLCILANMIEIAMKDSSLHRIEQEYIRKFVEASGLKAEQYKAINSVLYVKNWTGVLDE
ncbi:MAG: TerB family tellurite resistance protein [Lentisphaerae bacterium]|nr:TerB family tellurite resistance protein [Lentisphaerota bacterium]